MTGLGPVARLLLWSQWSQTSSTGPPHVETLTSPPTTKKKKKERNLGWDRQGGGGERGGEKCVVGSKERKTRFPRKYRLTAAKIKARPEPKTHLKNLSAVSPSSLASVTHFHPPPTHPSSLLHLSQFFPCSRPHSIQEFCEKKPNAGTPFSERMVSAREQRAYSLFFPFPSVLCSLPFTRRYLKSFHPLGS